uniref:Uncharacterized protein n=1 Tax=Opuntia streptacantha TaxID=393608 RepID=A0A7C9EG52_OPUST
MTVLDRPEPPKTEKTINLPLAFFLSCNKRQRLAPLKVLTQIESPLDEQNRTNSMANHLNSWKVSLMKNLLRLLDSDTLKGNAPPTPPQNSNSLPSTFTEANIITPEKKTTRRAQRPEKPAS